MRPEVEFGLRFLYPTGPLYPWSQKHAQTWQISLASPYHDFLQAVKVVYIDAWYETMADDPYAQCFLKSTPPNNETFSHRRTPCRFEPPLTQTETTVMCPFRASGFCDKVAQTRLDSHQSAGAMITAAYSEHVKNLLSESSTSIVVRSEQQFHSQDLFRTTQRRHLYEALQSGDGNWQRFGIGCTPLHEEDRFGEYLGFLDLREYFNKSPIAFALLVEPGSVREDPRAFVMKGDYGPLFGSHSFRSTVYVMQDPKTAGAMCAQACIIMTLGMLGDRKSEIKGSFTVTYLGHIAKLARSKQTSSSKNSVDLVELVKLIREDLDNTPEQESIDGDAEVKPYSSLQVDGLKPNEIGDVLSQCNVESRVVEIPHKESFNGLCSTSIREALRIIEGNIRARFPVILSVSATAWVRDSAEIAINENIGHAVNIVGIRSNARGEVTSLIVHDPASQPFLERSPASCFRAAWRLPILHEGNWQPANRYYLIVATESSVKLHAHECLKHLYTGLERPHFRAYYNCMPHTNYRISLSNARSVMSILFPEKIRDDSAKLLIENELARFSRVWSVVGYLAGTPKIAWLFDANRNSERPFFRIMWDETLGEPRFTYWRDNRSCTWPS